MTTITAEKARSQLSELINRARYNKERTLITSHGKKSAIVPVEDLELLELLLEKLEYQSDLEEAKAALEEVEREGTVPWDDVKRELGL